VEDEDPRWSLELTVIESSSGSPSDDGELRENESDRRLLSRRYSSRLASDEVSERIVTSSVTLPRPKLRMDAPEVDCVSSPEQK
jgi:hypothetical protein